MDGMNKLISCGLTSAAILLLGASSSSAQSQTLPENRWSRGTTLSLSGGAASASGDTGALVAGTIGWELNRQLALKGAGTWLDRDPGAGAWAASFGLHATLPKVLVLPFVEGGFGIYLASFDPKRATSIPPFYANRMSGAVTQTFVDPALFLSGGIDLFRNDHLIIRPAAGAMVAVRSGHASTVGTFSIEAEYHFEGHPSE